jgi:hypothetical protein
LRYSEAESLCGLEVDDKLVSGRRAIIPQLPRLDNYSRVLDFSILNVKLVALELDRGYPFDRPILTVMPVPYRNIGGRVIHEPENPLRRRTRGNSVLGRVRARPRPRSGDTLRSGNFDNSSDNCRQ